VSEHDVVRFASDLSARLAARSRHVCVLLGAGSSRACGLPDVRGLEALVAEQLEEPDRDRFKDQLEGRNLEQVLSRLRRIAALVGADQTVDGLTGPQALQLDTAICKAIVRNLAIREADLVPVKNFAAWAGRANYHLPLEVFTVNYDLLLETAFEERAVPYFDGFVGSLRARFRTDFVEATPTSPATWVPPVFLRLWKIHGSVNWVWSEEDRAEILRLGGPVAEGKAAAIYPSDVKYEESRRVPFVVLQDRFRRALNEPESLTLISGYSFSDDHLNELIFESVSRRERSEVIAFCFDALPDKAVAWAMTTPNLQLVTAREGVLGGVRGEWVGPDENVTGLWVDKEFALHDFRHLATYLAKTSAEGSLSRGDAISLDPLENES
jgi:hypothetical protein